MARLAISALLLLLDPLLALNVAVVGATGRTGQLVVKALERDGHSVRALVRNREKAQETLPSSPNVECKVIDFCSAPAEEVLSACKGMDRLVFCATGFTESGDSVDQIGMKFFLPAFQEDYHPSSSDAPPKVVLLSSAGVTRTSWDEDKKQRLIGASDIPIIRLNPGGILEKKCEAEDMLRQSGVPYCVVRPTGLKFEGWPQGRPIFSQGDVAVGRTNPMDLADVLVSVLTEPAASGKTFEMFTLTGYPAPRSCSTALERLKPDSSMPLQEAEVEATYNVLQQMLPGEEQDATKLEMGRTYEQVDSRAVAARERGAAPTERERELAAGVAQTAKSGLGIRRLLQKIF
mmetsp:Transcript_58987/g.128074  ORF Transcript_58987/g.128074 Transcript_58987/m.128074 type:complete len:347 (-) Transcript_58987:222-1262(-)